jgi:hypothetical protein
MGKVRMRGWWVNERVVRLKGGVLMSIAGRGGGEDERAEDDCRLKSGRDNKA